ncbi:hypothetical protein D3C79_895290 [compost metagenome]
MARIDKQHRDVGRGSSGDHVAGVLFMPRGVGHDKFAVCRGEETVGHIDGDALLSFCCEPIDQQGEVDSVALRAMALGVFLQSA